MSQKLDWPFYPTEQPSWNMRGQKPYVPWAWQTQGYSGLSKHEGRDYGLAQESPYHASGDGIIVDKQVGWIGGGGGGWGTHYVILYPDVELRDGTVRNVFVRTAHMSKAPLEIGDKVVRGQVIGTSGNTGTSSGPHLHLETRFNFKRNVARGDLIDPEKVFFWPNQNAEQPTEPTKPQEPQETPEQKEEKELMGAKEDIITAVNAKVDAAVAEVKAAMPPAPDDDKWMAVDESENKLWLYTNGFRIYVEPVYKKDAEGKDVVDDEATSDRIQDLIAVGYDMRHNQGDILRDLPIFPLKFS